MLSSMFNVIGFSWEASPASTELESIVLGENLARERGWVGSRRRDGWPVCQLCCRVGTCVSPVEDPRSVSVFFVLRLAVGSFRAVEEGFTDESMCCFARFLAKPKAKSFPAHPSPLLSPRKNLRIKRLLRVSSTFASATEHSLAFGAMGSPAARRVSLDRWMTAAV